MCIRINERTFARASRFELNEAAFDDSAIVELKYDIEIAGARWMIYGVKTVKSKTRKKRSCEENMMYMKSFICILCLFG